MKKFFHISLVLTISIFGIIFLLGKFHFLLGCFLEIIQMPFILVGFFILLRRRSKKFLFIHKILLLVVSMLLLNFLYENIRRINFKNVSNTNKEVSILTYNLFFKNKYPNPIIKEIKEVEADIVILQELTSDWDQVLKNTIYKKYKYQKTYINNGTHGLAVISKYPIQSCEYLKNSSGLPVNQICKIKINDKDLILVNSHLSSPAIAVENPEKFLTYYKANTQRRFDQWETLNKYLNKKYPNNLQIVAGDLNTMKIEPLYREIRHEWNDLFTKKGSGPSWNFPNSSRIPYPLITLDYILFKGNIKPIESKILKGSSSDHFAVFGKVEI